MQQHPFLSGSVAHFLAAATADARADLRARFQSLAIQHNYDNILLVDPGGAVSFSLHDPGQRHRGYAAALAAAFADGTPVFTPLHIEAPGLPPHISVIAPLFTPSGAAREPLGAVVFVCNADQFLYPLIQAWPVSSDTAETVLVRRDGDGVLYLNDLRHREHAALRLRLPLTRMDSPAVMAVQGRRGFVTGTDYRGMRVAAVILPLEDSPWFMVAKVDAAEAFAAWRFRSLALLALYLGVLALTGLGGIVWWQHRKKVRYAALYRSEAARRASMERYRVTLQSIGDAVIATDAQGMVEFLNPVAAALTGWSEVEARGRSLADIFPIVSEKTRRPVENPVARVLREGASVGLANHTLLVARDGTEWPIADSGAPIRDADGEITGVVLVFRDQSAERTAAAALRQSEGRWQFALDGAGDGVWDWNAQTGEVFYSPRWKAMLGYAEAEIGNTLAEWEGRLHPEDREGVQTELQRYLAGQTPSYVSEHRLRCRDGSWKWILDRGKVVQRGTDGEPQRIIGTHTDIDVRKQMEEKLRHLTAVLRAVRHVNQLMTQEKDRDRLLRRACAGLIATRGYHYCWIALDDAEGGLRAVAEAGVGADFAAVRVALERGDWPASCRQVMGAAADIAVRHGTASDCATCSLVSFRGDTATLAGRLRHADRDYGVLVVALPAALADDAEEQSLFRELAGDLGYALHLLEMEQDRERLISAMEQTGEAVVITDSVGIIRYVNPAFERITGYPRAEALGRPPGFLKSGEQDADFYRDLWGTIAAGRAWQGRLVNRRRDGDLYTEEMSISPVSDQAGRISAYVAVKRDITGRLLLERQLRQAQKMEAVGRLAGGVAHDYNNMLTVISGYAEMALTRVERDDPLHEDLTEILAAARRSTDITRQLLAFSRQLLAFSRQQTIKPRVLDLIETVAGMMKMLRRLIGEDIDLAWRPAADICAVKVDPTQIDQVLANLCVNARDAITGVGKVVIETGRATFDETYCSLHQGFVPGRFALLAVSDDGCGMDEKTRDNLFEPFFTTKERGRGTGLGLATVYGIVKQNDGFINVYSEPDNGTTFRIYLPCHADGEAKPRDTGITAAVTAGGNETILLVEDEPAIMVLTRRMLEGLGYLVLAADTPGVAMRLAAEHGGAIRLLITDVVMPEMNGRELEGQLKTLCPHIKTIFMSGYTADVIAHRGVLDNGVNFVQKPFSIQDLGARIRAVLEPEEVAVDE